MRALGTVVVVSVLAALGLVAAPPSNGAPSTGAPATAAAVTVTGRLSVLIRTPAGVPAAVRLVGPWRRVVAKPVRGTSVRVTDSVRPGRYVVRPVLTTYKGVLYVGVASHGTVAVTARHTAYVTVRFARAVSASALHATNVTATTISLAWSAPRGVAFSLRRTTGGAATTSRLGGVGVKVVGHTAVSRGLKAGGRYSYSLFTEYRRHWIGPITLSAGTTAPAGSHSATFVTSPGTQLPAATAVTAVAGTGSGLDVTLGAGTPTPVPGAVLVLPRSARLPGGYIGRVTTVGANGTAVKLVPAALSDAFSYYSIDVPHFQSKGVVLKPAASGVVAGAQPMTPATGTSCKQFNTTAQVSFTPTVSLSGSFHGHLDTATFLHIPTGASFDVTLSASLAGALSVTTAASLTCSLTFDPIPPEEIAEAPVPIDYDLSLAATVSVTGQVKATNLGAQVTGGIHLDAKLGLTSGVQVSGGPVLTAQPLTPQWTGSGTVGLKVGGTLIVGPGLATPDAGVVAGFSGSLFPLSASIGPQFTHSGDDTDACIKTTAALTAQLGLTAKAWLGSWSGSATVALSNLGGPYNYGGPWYWPDDCDMTALHVPDQTLPDATAHDSYLDLLPASGGADPYTWSLDSGAVDPGSLPPGLTLGPDGTVSGKPTTPGAYQFLVKVVDGNGNVAVGLMSIDVQVNSAPGFWSGTVDVVGSETDTCEYSNEPCGNGFSDQHSTDASILFDQVPGDPDAPWSNDGEGPSNETFAGYDYEVHASVPDGYNILTGDPCTASGSLSSTNATGTFGAFVSDDGIEFGMSVADTGSTQQQVTYDDENCQSVIDTYLSDDIVYGGLGLCWNGDFGYHFDASGFPHDVVRNGQTVHVYSGTEQVPCSAPGTSGSITLTYDLTYTVNPDAAPEQAARRIR